MAGTGGRADAALGRLTAIACVGALGLAAAPTSGAWLAWAGALVIGGTAVAANAVAMLVVIQRYPPPATARASGMVSAGFFAGFALGPALFGLLVDTFESYPIGWLTVLGVLGAASLVAGRHRRQSSLRHDRGDTLRLCPAPEGCPTLGEVRHAELGARLQGEVAAAPLSLVVLHGSRARSEERPGSDWDIGVLADAPPDLADVAVALSVILGTDDIDVVDLRTAGALLRYTVPHATVSPSSNDQPASSSASNSTPCSSGVMPVGSSARPTRTCSRRSDD